MTFRQADQKGFQPDQCPIVTACALDACATTDLDVATLCASMRIPPFIVSTDPGRYLCNYVYYNSLAVLHNPHALFVHVPRVELIPLADQVAAVKALVQLIVEQVVLQMMA